MTIQMYLIQKGIKEMQDSYLKGFDTEKSQI